MILKIAYAFNEVGWNGDGWFKQTDNTTVKHWSLLFWVWDIKRHCERNEQKIFVFVPACDILGHISRKRCKNRQFFCILHIFWGYDVFGVQWPPLDKPLTSLRPARDFLRGAGLQYVRACRPVLKDDSHYTAEGFKYHHSSVTYVHWLCTTMRKKLDTGQPGNSRT